MDAESAKQSVINTLGKADAFTNANTRDAAIKMYLQLQGY
jgi:prophage maintenance system killer protein